VLIVQSGRIESDGLLGRGIHEGSLMTPSKVPSGVSTIAVSWFAEATYPG
jgi:hypothetical protein